MHTKVRKILERKGQQVETVSPESTIPDAIELMAKKSIGSLLVVDTGGQVKGILSERDVFRKVCLPQKDCRKTTVSEVMSSKVLYVSPDKNLADCMDLMTQKRIRHLPVMENDTLVGIVSIGDVVKCMTSERDLMIENLEKYIEGSL